MASYLPEMAETAPCELVTVHSWNMYSLPSQTASSGPLAIPTEGSISRTSKNVIVYSNDDLTRPYKLVEISAKPAASS